jgi:hypothetical protein
MLPLIPTIVDRGSQRSAKLRLTRELWMKEDRSLLKRVIIEKLGLGGHTAIETGFDEATVLVNDEVARGCIIYCRDTHQAIQKKEDFASLGKSDQEPIRIMVIPPVAGG